MPFRFALASVLKFRQDLEQREMRLLEKCYADLAATQAHYWQAEERISHEKREREEQLRQGTTAVQLHLALEYEARLQHQLAALQEKLREAQEHLRQQLETYRKARQNRDIIEELRKQQLDAYRRNEAKLEQRQRDELFLLRRMVRH
jgi:flagellar export protein FliJ